LFATSGMRHGELAALTFDNIDFERGVGKTIHPTNNKKHAGREVLLEDQVLGMLHCLKREASDRKPVPRLTSKPISKDHVFVTKANTPWEDGRLLRRFYAICRKAGIEGAHPNGSVDIHALRGTFITLSLSNGGHPKDVQEIVGHKTSRMTMDVYAKATDAGRRKAINALPFASMAAPDHIVPMVSPVVTAQPKVEGGEKTSARTG